MKRPSVVQLVLPGLLALLAACDATQVEVNFAEPFPAGAADVAAFAPRQLGRYVALGDSDNAVLVTASQVVREWAAYQVVRGRWLDSVGLPRRAGWWPGPGRRYQVQPLRADTFQLKWLGSDTVLTLGPGQPGHLRRYQGWYYLSLPDPDRPGSWWVQRLALHGPRLTWQRLNPDSLRLRALAPADLQEQREPRLLRFIIRPRSGRARRQVGHYAGLWRPWGEYER